MPYSFFDNILRIAADDYLATNSDIFRVRRLGIKQIRIEISSLACSFVDIGDQWSSQKKWMHQFENVASIIFVADISSYDEVILENPGYNRLMESLVLFDNVVNSQWFVQSSVILLLSNFGRFKEKLYASPLERYFCDYTGGIDLNRAMDYILFRFKGVNRSDLTLYTYWTDPGDPGLLHFIKNAVQDTVIERSLKILNS